MATNTLVGKIRRLRRQYGWTQRELAGQLQVDSVTVSRWERGVTVPRPGVMRSLERLLTRPSPGQRAPVSVSSGQKSAGVDSPRAPAWQFSQEPSIDELVQLIGVDAARSALRTVALRARAARPVEFAADPATRLREVESALREQSDLISRARIG